MIIRNGINKIDNLSSKLDKKVNSAITHKINLNNNVTNRGASNMRGGLMYFSAFPMKNTVSTDYAMFGGSGTTVGP